MTTDVDLTAPTDAVNDPHPGERRPQVAKEPPATLTPQTRALLLDRLAEAMTEHYADPGKVLDALTPTLAAQLHAAEVRGASGEGERLAREFERYAAEHKRGAPGAYYGALFASKARGEPT